MEAKKRIRPTMAQVRELEKQVKDQTEALHERCMEADGWREKYRELKEKHTDILAEAGEALGLKAKAVEALEDAQYELRQVKKALDEVHCQMDGMKAMNEKLERKVEGDEELIALLRQENDRMGTRLYEMQNRGLLARIFNK